MMRTIPACKRTVFPAVDLGGTKIAFAFVDTDDRREIAREYPPTEVVKVKGRTDANRTLRRVAGLIRKRTSEVEKRGWTVLRLVGIGAPGLYLEDNSVDPKTVPNIPGLAKIMPAKVLERLLGEAWKVYINNDGVVQAIASAYAFVHSPDFAKKWAKTVGETGGKVVYFGPGTGFGAGKVLVLEDKRVEPAPGSQAFFDILIRDGKSAEALIGGYGIGRIAELRERRNLKKGKPLFLRFTDGVEAWAKDPNRTLDPQLDKISGKSVAKAYGSGDKEAKKQAKEILVQVGRDLARLIIRLHTGRGKKKVLEWDRDDWRSVKGTRVFLVAGLLTKPTGKQVILPAAREALKEAGYAGRVHIVEIDRLETMRKMQGRIGIWGASLIVPQDEILGQKWENSLIVGTRNVNRHISQLARKAFLEKGRTILLAVDGYAGVDWPGRIPPIKKRLENDGFRVRTIDFSKFYKPANTIEEMIRPSMTKERTFGRIFDGSLLDLLDEKRIAALRKSLQNDKEKRTRSPRAVLCFGSGAACNPLRKLYDIVLYSDITREEITKRSSRGLLVPLGARAKGGSGKGRPAYLAGKRFHYVDFPLLDKEKKSLLKRIDHYIDDNLSGQPKLVDRKTLDEMIANLVERPFQLKAFHDEGVWGGQWLKKVRKLPKEMVNCAWAYELMAYHMSVKIPVGNTFVEIPFPVILDKQPDKIMGRRLNRRFKGGWPIRVNYDDCWKGGDMAIQIHPDSAYIRKAFREPLHQDESYYIMAATPDACVHLGIKEGIDIGEFQLAVDKAEKQGIPFDHRKYVNVFPVKQGDLFLIPAGTVHASGKGCVVLELSATTDRYTFHFYDYLRPDLNGKLREIHAGHAFRMLHKYPDRTTSWVEKRLIQKPRCIRRGRDWAEVLLGKLDELVFEVHRFEFATTVEDDTKGAPHVLSLVDGEGVLIQSQAFPDRNFRLDYSETAIVPACLGEYSIENQGNNPCKVLKTIAAKESGKKVE